MTFGNVYFSKLRSQASGGLVKSQRQAENLRVLGRMFHDQSRKGQKLNLECIHDGLGITLI